MAVKHLAALDSSRAYLKREMTLNEAGEYRYIEKKERELEALRKAEVLWMSAFIALCSVVLAGFTVFYAYRRYKRHAIKAIKDYCCPIKLSNEDKVWLGCRF